MIQSPADFIHALPKAELHLHLEGSVDAPTLAELSRRPAPKPAQGNRYAEEELRQLSEADVERLYQYRDFEGFLMAFKAVTGRIRTAEDYELITYRLMQRLGRENVLHAEVYVSVGVVHWRGEDFVPLFDGMERGRRRGEQEFGVSLLWIFDAVRHFGLEAARQVAEQTARFHHANPSVVGFGLGGDERRAPAEAFRDLFAWCRGEGLRLTLHAGETAGPESIWGALNAGAERLGHGLTAVQDQELVDLLAERQVPVEVCISSNLRTGSCPSLEKHPVKQYFDEGVMVTLNTDDPAMFSTSLTREYQLAHETFGFTRDQLRELARNSFEASFLPPEKKLSFLKRFDESPDLSG